MRDALVSNDEVECDVAHSDFKVTNNSNNIGAKVGDRKSKITSPLCKALCEGKDASAQACQELKDLKHEGSRSQVKFKIAIKK